MNRRITRMTPWVAAMLIVSALPHGGLAQTLPEAEPLVAELQIVTIDLPNDDVSFTTLDGENGIGVTADLTPDSLDAAYNAQIRWDIEDDPDVEGVTPVPDITAIQGADVTLVIDIPLDPDGRGYVLNYRIRATVLENGLLIATQ